CGRPPGRRSRGTPPRSAAAACGSQELLQVAPPRVDRLELAGHAVRGGGFRVVAPVLAGRVERQREDGFVDDRLEDVDLVADDLRQVVGVIAFFAGDEVRGAGEHLGDVQLQVRVEFPEAAHALPGEAAADVGVDEHSPAQLAEGGVDGDL